jgi:hypothetical protein
VTRSALATFIGVYLDEDLFEAYVDEFEAADAFLVEQPTHAANMAREIDQLLASHPDEGSLATFMNSLGMGIDTDGLTNHEWLNKIADRVRVATA